MRELNYLSERFDDLLKELPVSSYAGFLEEARRKIKHLSERNQFYINLYKTANASGESKRLEKAILEGSQDGEYKMMGKDETNFSIRVFEEVFPSVAIVLLDEEMLQSEILIQHFKKTDSTYKVIFLVSLLSNTDPLRDFSRIFSHRTKVITLTQAEFTAAPFTELMKAHFEKEPLEKIKKMAYLNSVKPVFSFLDEILSAESKSANTRKLLNNQNTNITRKEEQSLNNSELTGNLRQIIQKSTQELEKSYKIKYEDLNKPNTGTFSIVTSEECALLNDFEKKELAEKSEKYETHIAKNFLDRFISKISGSINKELGKDEAFIKSSLEDLLAQINIQLKTKNIQPLTAAVFPPFPEKERVIQSFCYLNKTYTGEVIKKGAMEYFVALRDYTGLIMVVGGLLAPLSIVASASDSGLFKHVATWVKGSTAGISLLMIIYGIYDLRKRIPKKRVEEFQRELTKARELLQMEAKRMFNDSSRDWTSTISNWIRDATQNINMQIERNIKDQQTQRAGMMNQEKVQQQKLQQNIDMLLRSIQSAERVKDTMVTRYRDMVSETEKDLKL